MFQDTFVSCCRSKQVDSPPNNRSKTVVTLQSASVDCTWWRLVKSRCQVAETCWVRQIGRLRVLAAGRLSYSADWNYFSRFCSSPLPLFLYYFPLRAYYFPFLTRVLVILPSLHAYSLSSLPLFVCFVIYFVVYLFIVFCLLLIISSFLLLISHFRWFHFYSTFPLRYFV